ncbi:MAG TPA: DUF3667 domain-containing protein [Gemmatirosa sp.]
MLLREIWDTFGTIDGKLVRTVSLLVARPGALTVEWLHGRRAPYVRPINLYVTVSAAYFTALATTFRAEDFGIAQSAAETRADVAFRTKVARKYSHAVAPVRVLMLGVAQVGSDPAAAFREAIPSLPRIMFVLVPLCALLVQRTMRRRAWRYPAHLYFMFGMR